MGGGVQGNELNNRKTLCEGTIPVAACAALRRAGSSERFAAGVLSAVHGLPGRRLAPQAINVKLLAHRLTLRHREKGPWAVGDAGLHPPEPG